MQRCGHSRRPGRGLGSEDAELLRGEAGQERPAGEPHGAVEGGQERLGQPSLIVKPPQHLTMYPGRLTGRGDAEVVSDVVQSREVPVEVEQNALLERLADLWLERIESLVDLVEVEVVRTLVR